MPYDQIRARVPTYALEQIEVVRGPVSALYGQAAPGGIVNLSLIHICFNVRECAQCGHRVYPARLWCPACGHDRAVEAPVEEAELLAWIQVPGKAAGGGSIIATVNALPHGPLLVVRLPDVPQAVGRCV